MTPDAPGPEPALRGTAFQRARAGALGLLGMILAHLPAGVGGGLSDAIGELWYRAAPGRAAMARGNLAHVVAWLAAEGRGSARTRAAAGDAAALERLVRASFRHSVRTYVETLRGAAAYRDALRHMVIVTPEVVEAAFAAGGPAVLAAMHFGSMAGVSAVLEVSTDVPVMAPMETIDDPELQRLLRRAREVGGARTIPLADARRELRAALRRGEIVGLIADRDITGGGVPVMLFGLPTPLPIGPAYLALDSGAPLHVAATIRTRGNGYKGWLVTVPPPSADLPRRARIEAFLAAEAATFERLVGEAPEQWWTVFYPIWDGVGPRPRSAR